MDRFKRGNGVLQGASEGRPSAPKRMRYVTASETLTSSVAAMTGAAYAAAAQRGMPNGMRALGAPGGIQMGPLATPLEGNLVGVANTVTQHVSHVSTMGNGDETPITINATVMRLSGQEFRQETLNLLLRLREKPSYQLHRGVHLFRVSVDALRDHKTKSIAKRTNATVVCTLAELNLLLLDLVHRGGEDRVPATGAAASAARDPSRREEDDDDDDLLAPSAGSDSEEEEDEASVAGDEEAKGDDEWGRDGHRGREPRRKTIADRFAARVESMFAYIGVLRNTALGGGLEESLQTTSLHRQTAGLTAKDNDYTTQDVSIAMGRRISGEDLWNDISDRGDKVGFLLTDVTVQVPNGTSTAPIKAICVVPAVLPSSIAFLQQQKRLRAAFANPMRRLPVKDSCTITKLSCPSASLFWCVGRQLTSSRRLDLVPTIHPYEVGAFMGPAADLTCNPHTYYCSSAPRGGEASEGERLLAALNAAAAAQNATAAAIDDAEDGTEEHTRLSALWDEQRAATDEASRRYDEYLARDKAALSSADRVAELMALVSKLDDDDKDAFVTNLKRQLKDTSCVRVGDGEDGILSYQDVLGEMTTENDASLIQRRASEKMGALIREIWNVLQTKLEREGLCRDLLRWLSESDATDSDPSNLTPAVCYLVSSVVMDTCTNVEMDDEDATKLVAVVPNHMLSDVTARTYTTAQAEYRDYLAGNLIPKGLPRLVLALTEAFCARLLPDSLNFDLSAALRNAADQLEHEKTTAFYLSSFAATVLVADGEGQLSTDIEVVDWLYVTHGALRALVSPKKWFLPKS